MNNFEQKNGKYLPETFYNIKADLPSLPPPPKHPLTGEPLRAADLEPLFPAGFVAQETSLEREIPIPAPVRSAYSRYRPTPLVYAAGLKAMLSTPAHIFYKYEGVSPAGSHKTNTALMQAYLAAQEGVEALTTETGAGQWGSALADAGARFGVQVRVFMVRVSCRQKPGRRLLMEMLQAQVSESPSRETASGRAYLRSNPEHPGSLGIAISEAIEYAMHNNAKYALGSVLDAVLLHQTVIGQEAMRQLAEAGAEPDLVIGCVGGGSNFAGIAFPFLARRLRNGKGPRLLAVEPEACPSLTHGERRYDHGDSAGLTPLLFMHTLGCDFIPPPIHAGGLRYHGTAPLLSHAVALGLVDAMAVAQDEAFSAAQRFYLSEGILPAPETAHAIAAVIRAAETAKREKKETVILFNLSGHGYFDVAAYAKENLPPT